jgi:serine/threonine protein kinase
MEKIGKYEVIRKLGEGATSSVYLARDPFANREVAIKKVAPGMLRDTGGGNVLRRLFMNEASLAGKLVHPHIVEIYDAVADEDQAYLVMEYVPGGTLQPFTRADNLLALGDVIEIVYKCARALDFASQLGVIHRDIKPANILVMESNDIKLSDFVQRRCCRASTYGGRDRRQLLSPAAPQQTSMRPISMPGRGHVPVVDGCFLSGRQHRGAGATDAARRSAAPSNSGGILSSTSTGWCSVRSSAIRRR